MAGVAGWSERFRFKFERRQRGARGEALADSNIVVKKALPESLAEAGFPEDTRDTEAIVPVADFHSLTRNGSSSSIVNGRVRRLYTYWRREAAQTRLDIWSDP